ncbi:hypothetical protein O3M35_010974 [Rhynocoris fuscipes]|uniref:Sulfotransferase domain-containing protein n=1 Tax=Rhynocoris fuscipes TaxID=488301 RepID=A0AAW1D437_9HEMI
MDDYTSEVCKVDEEWNEELMECYPGERSGWYWYGPKRFLVPSPFLLYAEKYFNFQTRPDDVWLVTFPRSGTTLTQEILWLLTHNLDFETAKELNVWERTPFYELDMLFHPETKQKFLDENEGNIHYQNMINRLSEHAYLTLETMDSPRVIKTHFPISMLPYDVPETKPKIVYVARNPIDVALSYYHLLRLWRTSDLSTDFKTFISQFERGLVMWGPFFEHIKEGWDMRGEDRFFFMFYEDLTKDMKGTLRKLAEFLEVDVSDEGIEELADHVNIKNFKNNKSVNFEEFRDVGVLNKTAQEGFIRQGKSRGDGKEYTEEILEHFQKWYQENCEKYDIQFPSKE